MLDVLTFFSPALALGCWKSAHSAALLSASDSVYESMEDFGDIFSTAFRAVLPFALVLLGLSMCSRMIHLILDPRY